MTVVTALMISLTACYLIYNKKDYSDDWWEIWCTNEWKNSVLKVLVVPSEKFVSNAHKNSHAQFEFWLLFVCMYVCMYLYAHKLLCQNEFWLLCTHTSSKWGFAHDIVCFGCCMQPSSYVQMSFACCMQPSSYVQMSFGCCMQPSSYVQMSFGCCMQPSSYVQMSFGCRCNQVLMSKWVWGFVCDQVLMSKWVWGVVCDQVLMSKWVWGVVSPTSSLCAREITRVPWQLQH